jgi:hypothetical protein
MGSTGMLTLLRVTSASLLVPLLKSLQLGSVYCVIVFELTLEKFVKIMR